MLHLVSGQCVKSEDKGGVELGDCATPKQWNHSGDGSPDEVVVKRAGFEIRQRWKSTGGIRRMLWRWKQLDGASKANLQLANKIGEDNFCLEKESDTIVVVKKCICFRDEGSCTDDPQPQWFKLVPTNVA